MTGYVTYRLTFIRRPLTTAEIDPAVSSVMTRRPLRSAYPHIVGMLLEEFVLKLLQASGYVTVTNVGGDPALSVRSAGMCVEGRGGIHQIDAIADYNIPQPFSHPSRLLVEAKAYTSSLVGIEIVRNSVGVLHDVNEWWWKDDLATTYKRHIYNYAIFTMKGFTHDAQMYGFAHGIFLVPLARSGIFRPVIAPLQRAASQYDATDAADPRRQEGWLHRLRMRVRQVLNGEATSTEDYGIDNFCQFINERYEGALLATLAGKIPVFLLPTPGALDYVYQQARLERPISVRVFWDDDGWYLDDQFGRRLFSFDLPDLILQRYAGEGRLNQRDAITLKRQELAQFDAVLTWNEKVTRVRFVLDDEWIEGLRRRMRNL